MKTVLLLLLNELRGLAMIWLWTRVHPQPAFAILTAAVGLAFGWVWIWRDIVKPELIARERQRILCLGRAGLDRGCAA